MKITSATMVPVEELAPSLLLITPVSASTINTSTSSQDSPLE